jgi:CheY-like chemotaxis protein
MVFVTAFFGAISDGFSHLPVWVEMSIVSVIIGGMVIFFWGWIAKLRHQKMELKRQLIEKTELLTYCEQREGRAREKVIEIAESKTKLLNSLNYEIRTPMSGVMGMVSLLAETPLNAEQRECNETIRNCGESLIAVINDILLGDVLAHAKVESGAELEESEFDLRNAIEETFDVFTHQISQKDLELVYQVDPRIPSQLISDSTRVKQVLMNLVDNAIRFTKHGEIVVRVWIIAEGANGVLDLGFEVQDSGVGISSDDLKFLTHTISQPDAQRAGVGLFLCSRLVHRMEGDLKIDSQLNEGTTVRFNIHVKANASTQPVYPEMAGIKGKKVLIIEDNTALRSILREELLNWQLVPFVAESGREALEILSEKSGIDLVLAEMQMPVMDGLELSKAINERYPKLPIILMTKANDEASRQYSGILSSTVCKPLRYGVLIQHIFSVLHHKDETHEQNNSHVKQKLSTDFAVKNPLRILVAEDNPVNLKLAMKVLGKLGYTPDKAENGKVVLEEVSKKNYDLILMDVQMPEMDGLEATRMIRLCLSKQPVVVAMTANTLEDGREECLHAGMDDYISKPMNIEELVITLEKWARQVEARSMVNSKP